MNPPRVIEVRKLTHPTGLGVAKVVPPLVELSLRDMVEFRYDGSSDFTLVCPYGRVFGGLVFRNNPIKLTVLDMPPIGEKDFPFSIFCYDIEDLAQGTSPPRMRIKRPPIY